MLYFNLFSLLHKRGRKETICFVFIYNVAMSYYFISSRIKSQKVFIMLKWNFCLNAFETIGLSVKFLCSRLGFLNIHEKTKAILQECAMNIIMCYEQYNSVKTQYALFQLVMLLKHFDDFSKVNKTADGNVTNFFGTEGIFSSIIVLLI